MELPDVRPEERTPLVESLLAIIRQLLDRVEQLEGIVQQLRDENAILKGQKPRPKISPSRLEAPAPAPPPQHGKRPGSDKRSKNNQLIIPEDVRLHPEHLPPGAVLKDYEPYVVQELTIQAKATRYLRARYELPDGGSVLAPLPADVLPGSHYGPNPFRCSVQPEGGLSEHRRRAQRDSGSQGGLAACLEAARGAVAQQRLGVGYPGVREEAQDQRWYTKHGRPALPRQLCQLEEDLPETGRQLLDLPAGPDSRTRQSDAPGRPDSAASGQEAGTTR